MHGERREGVFGAVERGGDGVGLCVCDASRPQEDVACGVAQEGDDGGVEEGGGAEGGGEVVFGRQEDDEEELEVFLREVEGAGLPALVEGEVVRPVLLAELADEARRRVAGA